MFNNLLESRAIRKRSFGTMLLSAVVHVSLGAGAVYATMKANQAFEKPKAEKVDFVATKKDPPPPKEDPKPPPPDVTVAPPPPKGFQILTAPIKIPDVIPQIDLSHAVTRAEDFTGKGAEGGTATGVVGGTAAPIADDSKVFYGFNVEQQAQLADGNQPPTYPAQLRNANLEGKVLVTFVVDTTGKADMSTFRVISTTNELFSNAVKEALKGYKFVPALIGNHKVKQLVQQPFNFSLNK